ncbi:MAG: nickel pincer cofactor biosynthesis protein LarB [Planctomycetes bacterium]|nr:nickel pincer cofactor biosynthesis protein LarB [Planctomycetota bacterium]
MDPQDIQAILKKVWDRKMTAAVALEKLRHLPFEEIPYARVDSHRHLRCGFPEVIFCQGKEPADITAIARSILKRSDYLLATRADRTAFEAIRKASRRAVHHERARCVTVRKKAPPRQSGKILVVCAGTADVPVAEEARITAEMMGHEVDGLYDVGVAGIHRLLAAKDRISAADVIVVVAGMEGALASVVGGLTRSPVVAVPTSIGYGANLGGIAPLLTMLNSCAAGVSVVNIDNGFGAGYAAALMARLKNPA